MHEAWRSDDFEGMPYRVLLPEPYDVTQRYPLVLFLHGSGERGRDNARQLTHGVHHFADAAVRARHRCLVVAPQCPPESSWGGTWFGGPNETQARVVRLVEGLASRRTVDPARISLLGASMGAIGGWEILARHRALFSSAVMLCGEPDVAWAGLLSGFPVWSFHGAADELVKPGPTRALHALLPPPARLTEYPGRGHDIWAPVFAEAGLNDWLLSPPRG